MVGAAANGRFASAARQDYAAAAAAALTAKGAGNRIYELAGDGFTLDDFAAEVTKQSGKKVAYSNLTPEQYREALVGSGMPAAVAGLVADFDRAAAQGDLDGPSDDLRRLIGRAPTTLSNAIAAALKDPSPAHRRRLPDASYRLDLSTLREVSYLRHSGRIVTTTIRRLELEAGRAL